MLRWCVASTLLMAAFSVGSVPDERVVVIEPFDFIPFNSQLVVTISGWPDSCLEVDLDFVDGSGVTGDPGDVLASAGTFELSNGATQATIPTPEPAEYNLRVSGTDPKCGEPYFSSDFFVDGNGDIEIDADSGRDSLTIIASNWSPNCPTLDVTLRGPWAEEGFDRDDNVEIPGIEPTDWQWGEIALIDGSGFEEGPLPSMPERRTYWVVTIAGDPDLCGYPKREELHLVVPPEPFEPPITIVATPGPSIESVSVSPSCDGDDGILNVTIHQPEMLGTWQIAFSSLEHHFLQHVDVTEPTSVVYSFGPIPSDAYEVAVDEPSGNDRLFSVTVACPSAAEPSTTSLAAAAPTSSSQPSTVMTLPMTGAAAQTDATLLVISLLLVASGSALLVARRR